MKIKLQLLFYIFFTGSNLYSQKQGNIWYFGSKAGLDFNSGIPVALNNGALTTQEGCSSISDANGNLLFYTDGVTVYNKNHIAMKNGKNLFGENISAQSSVIVPLPGSTTIYYIFTMRNWETGGNGAHYSILDMSLDGNLGDIVAASKNILLNAAARESLTATKHCNGIDFWITFHDRSTNSFKTYLLTNSGLSPLPLISNVSSVSPGVTGNRYGCLNFSPNGKKLVFSLGGRTGTKTTVELYDFDNSTGNISNPQILATGTSIPAVYSCEFSPDNKLLYVVAYNGTFINQFNLLAGNTAQIVASLTNVAANSPGNIKSGLQTGPDGKIYVSLSDQKFVGVINNPNNVGLACSYINNAISLGIHTCGLGFPNIIESFFYNSLELGNDTTVCNGLITLNAGIGWDSYLWNTGNATQSLNVNTTGTYWVKTTKNGCLASDTIKVNLNSIPVVYLGADTSLCSRETLTLNAGNTGSIYLWSTGEKTQTITVSTSGIYWVDVTSGTCKSRDSIKVTFLTATPVNLGKDTSTCESSILLNSGISGATYLWSTGEKTQTINVKTSDTYWVEVTSGTCKSRDSIEVTFLTATPVNLGKDTSTCESSILLNSGISGATYLWSTGEKTQTISVKLSDTYWVEVISGTCKSRDSIEVTFLTATPVNLGKDTSTCESSILLNSGISGATYLWSTGEKTQTISVNTSGTYWVEVNDLRCVASDTINVHLNPVPIVNLGIDTSLCFGETITLDAGNTDAGYLWSSGDTSKNFIVSNAGIYWVLVKNYLCEASDSINIKFNDCEILVTMPNVFTPNGDGKNDRFLPITYKGILNANIKIYNRWGNLVYESENLLGGWDGKNNGAICSDGTYYWIVDYTDILNNHNLIDGFLSLLK